MNNMLFSFLLFWLSKNIHTYIMVGILSERSVWVTEHRWKLFYDLNNRTTDNKVLFFVFTIYHHLLCFDTYRRVRKYSITYLYSLVSMLHNIKIGIYYYCFLLKSYNMEYRLFYEIKSGSSRKGWNKYPIFVLFPINLETLCLNLIMLQTWTVKI